MKKILFFTPYGSITGSEVILWTQLQSYNRANFQAGLYSEQLGPLTKQLPSDIPLFTSPFNKGGLQTLFAKTSNAMGVKVHENNIIKIHEQFKPDYWYLNTVLMFYLGPLAKRLGVKVIVQIVELHSIFESVSYDEMAQTMQSAELAIGLTQQICELATIMGAKRTSLQYPVVDFSQKKVDPRRVAELRKSLGIPADAFVWTMVGTRIYRKGVDIFPLVAQALSDRPCYFLWMGNSKPTGLNYLVDKQIESLGLRNVAFVDVQTDDYYNYLQLADAMVMTSREEAFGKIIIEAAALGKPIVAPVAGGAKEFILPGMGILVDYPTPEEFRKAMLTIMTDPTSYNPALLIEKSKEYDVDKLVKKWEQAILEL